MPDCTTSINISSQSDIDQLDSPCYSDIVVQGAMSTLNFTTLTGAETITTHDSPALETLYFPLLSRLRTLEIANTTALTSVFLPVFSTGWLGFFDEGGYAHSGDLFSLNISTAPKLITLELGNVTSFANLSLFDTSVDFPNDLGTSNVSSALLVQTNSRAYFHSLQDVGELEIFAIPGWSYGFYDFRSAGNITISNANDFFWLNFDDSFGSPPIKINGSFVLESSAQPDPFWARGSMKFGQIGTVGDDLNISSMSDTSMDFGGVTDVGGDLSLVGNTNCSWSFDQITSAGNLAILDNENTTIPLFPLLQTVENIHLRGNIDTSTGPNIFPTLVLARGNVTIEVWNTDFSCSKLVSQWNDGVIHNLYCNGTDGTEVSAPNPADNPTANISTANQGDSTHLSTGALAGIGVGSGLFALLVISIIVWIVLHYRRRLRSLEIAHVQPAPFGNPDHNQAPAHTDVGGIYEVDGAGIIREKPHDPIIPELSDSRPELPTSPGRGFSAQDFDPLQQHPISPGRDAGDQGFDQL